MQTIFVVQPTVDYYQPREKFIHALIIYHFDATKASAREYWYGANSEQDLLDLYKLMTDTCLFDLAQSLVKKDISVRESIIKILRRKHPEPNVTTDPATSLQKIEFDGRPINWHEFAKKLQS